MTRANLFVQSRNGAWTIHPGNAEELNARLPTIKKPAFVRTDDGKIVGYTEKCDGRCDRKNCERWHCWSEGSEPFVGMEFCPWVEEESTPCT